MKDILVLSHCILNNAAKVAQDESELADEYRLRDSLLREALSRNIQLLQLPCPEFSIYGSRRWGHVKDQFMHPHFRSESVKMLTPLIDQLEEYMSYPQDFRVLGIVSVEGSPSCGYHLTCRGDWKGEMCSPGGGELSIPDIVMAEEPGAYMEILEDLLRRRDLEIPILSMEEATGIMEKL